MKLSYQWLNEWANTTLNAEQAGEILTLAGLELEEIEAAAPALDGVVVAEILSAEKHPDADRLQICQVTTGEPEPLQIVCGAPNARAGIKVALATIGTRLPGDFKIKKGKIRGAESLGMLCSGNELDLTETPGILELPGDFIVGQALSAAMGLDDKILEIALTPNRGDCFSVRGIARELACLSETPLTVPFENKTATVSLDDTRGISIEEAKDCSHYAARVIRGLDRQATTPVWMSERLRRSGLRSINPLVDVTNYVMLELGQPMHAFDLSKLNGDIQVRRARAGETLTLLNDQAVELSEQELVITDSSGPVALAGAMGGLSTAVDDSTVDVLLESACFSPSAVAGTGRRFKLSSDSLQRFERGVDPALQIQALERASMLLMSIAGGQAGPVCSHEPSSRAPVAIPLGAERVRKLLGCDISAERMVNILRKLDCEVQQDAEHFQITPPSHRYDLNAPIDFVEEIARIHGYDKLQGRGRKVAISLSANPKPDSRARLGAELAARGYFEAISFSFADSKTDDALCGDIELEAVLLDNPMSAAMSQMRRSVWASLMPVWKHNSQRQQDRIRLFEIGRKYGKRDGQMEEQEVIAGIVSGLALPEQWNQTKRAVDFYDLKADVQALLGPLARDTSYQSHDLHPALHPGRSARLERNGQTIGHLGQLHPQLLKSLDLRSAPLLFEINANAWAEKPALQLQTLTATPSSRRDIALVVDQSLAADKFIQYVNSNAGSLLREVRIFDVFTGDALPKGFKSVALGLIFQDFSRTLTDEEVDAAVKKLTFGLEQEFGAQIRD